MRHDVSRLDMLDWTPEMLDSLADDVFDRRHDDADPA